MIKKIFSRPQAVIGLVLIAAVVICAVFAPVIAPNLPDEIDPSLKYHEADAAYPLGTDQLGRCELSRLIYGARYSLGMSVPMMLILGAGAFYRHAQRLRRRKGGQDDHIYL